MFLSRYQHKIKTIDELVAIIKPFPRNKTVVMCHGVFDVVHPGHMRHLIYAKSKADILIASLTADHHITKSEYRPHIPQNIRAVNLAAFEMVDYVIIDHNNTPLENIEKLQPDFFAKGYEYSGKAKPKKTREEEELIQSYGGQMLFTPGDVVYSSSKFISMEAPVIRLEKLAAVMEAENIRIKDLMNSLNTKKPLTIHVVGDTIVDGITYTNVIGGQIKTPTLSVRLESQEDFVGGAGIVAKHLQAAGANVIFTTVLGEDNLAKFVQEDLQKAGVKVQVISDKNRPTTHKNAIVANNHRLVKIDTLDNSSISDSILEQFENLIATTQADAVIFSDFRHGIFNKRTIETLIAAIPEGCFKVADSQVASRWGNITEFKGFDLITPNEREARFALGDQDSGIRPLAARLYDEAQCKTLILKLGEKGSITCSSSDYARQNASIFVDAFADNVIDPVGSGDALLAYATLALVKGHSSTVASILGSIAAACECEVNGNIPISSDDVIKKIQQVVAHAEYLFEPSHETCSIEATFGNHGGSMKVIVVGLGVQGKKRQQHAGADFVASIDPVNPAATYKHIFEVPLSDYDAALVCLPDEPKYQVLNYLLENGKHVLVEKPLWTQSDEQILALEDLALQKNLVCYTAYNHRFEPHFVRMKELIDSGDLGEIYLCQLFYGNGTARLVRESEWRDQAMGVVPDLGSHLLDTVQFWFGKQPSHFQIVAMNHFENQAPDHAILVNQHSKPQISFEMSLLSWRNHFVCNIVAERGSAHIESLCKWGPSKFTYQKRILPSGRPPEQSVVLVQDDPTWALEYGHFKQLITQKIPSSLANDLWIQQELNRLSQSYSKTIEKIA